VIQPSPQGATTGTAFEGCACFAYKVRRAYETDPHGQDDPACRGGWSDHDLTPEGAAQAKALAARLKACGEAYSLAAVITSDLPRAVTTGSILADALSLPVVKEPRLREINNGDVAGMANETALKRYPGLFFSTLQMDEAYPKGESPRAFHDRIKNWFEELAAQPTDGEYIGVLVAFAWVESDSLLAFAWIDLISSYHLRRTV